MKKIIMFHVLLFTVLSTFAQQFELSGHIIGAKNGVKVFLIDSEDDDLAIIDSTTIKDEEFTFNGTFEKGVKYCSILVDNSTETTEDRRSYSFFATNSKMAMTSKIEELSVNIWPPELKPDQVVFTGSPFQDLYKAYKEDTYILEKQKIELWLQYLAEYHRPAIQGIMNTKRGLEIVKLRNENKRLLDSIDLAFIHNNKESVVGLYVATGYLQRAITKFSNSEIDEIVALFPEDLREQTWYKKIIKAAAASKILAKGLPYYDIPLRDSLGNQVKLSNYIQKGKYNMIEFWASWCQPCRAEIPHLKHLNQVADKSKMNFISISIDEKDDQWKKAMVEENMPWTQLNDDDTKIGPVSNIYGINAIPFCIIVDPEGKMIFSRLRGAELDLALLNSIGADAFPGL